MKREIPVSFYDGVAGTLKLLYENNPGGIKVSLNGIDLTTISGMVNQGW
jgi:hypothetical protein